MAQPATHQRLQAEKPAPSIRKEDIFFADRLKNLVARTLNQAVIDAKQINKGKLDSNEIEQLWQWLFSDRCKMWAEFVDVDGDELVDRLIKLMDSVSA